MSKLQKLKTKLKNSVDFLIDFAALATFAAALVYLSARAPEIHGYWLRSNVGKKVYSIRDNPRSGGGTGFAIKAPSGESYILTNDHVCEVSKDQKTVLVENDNGLSIRRAIIERSNFTDLCLIEGVPGVEGLEVGNAPTIGQIVASVGHPSLMPITLSRGEIIAQQDIEIYNGMISILNPETNKWQDAGEITAEECSLPKNRIVEEVIPVMFFEIRAKICLTVTEKAYRTNMLIQPGSSGSPIVNFWGNVVGVVFAGDRAMWGSTVNNQDLKKFLKNY